MKKIFSIAFISLSYLQIAICQEPATRQTYMLEINDSEKYFRVKCFIAKTFNQGDTIRFNLEIENKSKGKFYLSDSTFWNTHQLLHQSSINLAGFDLVIGDPIEFNSKKLMLVEPNQKISKVLELVLKGKEFQDSIERIYVVISLDYLPYKESLLYLTQGKELYVQLKSMTEMVDVCNTHEAYLGPILIKVKK